MSKQTYKYLHVNVFKIIFQRLCVSDNPQHCMHEAANNRVINACTHACMRLLYAGIYVHMKSTICTCISAFMCI